MELYLYTVRRNPDSLEQISTNFKQVQLYAEKLFDI